MSQEILISLFTSIPKYPEIENIDGFVYTICYHCWSKFYRKHKKHWHSANIDDMHNLSDDNDLQNEIENAVFIEKMKMEIAYLSKLHRDIITMTYYDGKSSAQISKELKISDSTVRWHLVETRKKLRGRIENMNTENLNCKPVKLISHGQGRTETHLCGIGQYRLVDNICYVCYGKPLTIEEIAQKLSVAAAFIEPHLEELVFMDYMKIMDGNKYQTNFFIRTEAFFEISKQYNYDNIKNKAAKLYETLEKRYDDIKAINFAGADLDRDFLFWILIPLLVYRLESKSNDIIKQKKEYFYCMPKRKDGTETWLRAVLQEDDYISALSEEVKEFSRKAAEYGWCDPCIPNEICSLQISHYATAQAGGRNALQGREFQELSRIVRIIAPKDIFDAETDYDKILIARYAEMGLVKVDHAKSDKIFMLIPYLKKEEYEKLNAILLDIEAELGNDYFVDYIESYMKKAKGQIPDFLPENEKNFVAAAISCIAALPFYLSTVGKLRYPTDEEAKRLGIIIWEMK